MIKKQDKTDPLVGLVATRAVSIIPKIPVIKILNRKHFSNEPNNCKPTGTIVYW